MRGEPTDYWGKVRRADEADKDSPVIAWHPLADHCADVAACFECLLQVPGFRRWLAAAAGMTEPELTDVHVGRLALLCFLHDLGKLNVGFQSKVFPTRDRHPTAPAGHTFDACAFFAFADLTPSLVEQLGIARMAGWFAQPADLPRFLLASWSHHGRPVPYNLGSASAEKPSRQVWGTWRYASLDRGLELMRAAIDECFPVAFQPATPFPHSVRLQAAFAGLVSLADWLGSSAPFTYSEEGDGPRIEWARRKAADVLTAMGLLSGEPRTALASRSADFEQVFGFSPTVVQAEVGLLPDARGGSVTLIESETGSGKTEAALSHAFRLYREGKIDGCYFALPTRTSGVQIHKRVTSKVRSAFGDAAPPVVLAVPGYVRVDEANGTLLPHFQVLWDDAEVGLRGWAAESSKRYLAAPFAVGTIDQALMAVIKAKHSHMRFACLARSLLIIDEVHASDAYMTALSVELVRRHMALGGHVLLMSATLGANAAARYLGEASLPLQQASSLPYPLIRMVDGTGTVTSVAPQAKHQDAPRRVKTVRLTTKEIIEDPSATARLAAQWVAEGARVLVIRNTVSDCVEVHKELARLLPAEQLFLCEGIHAPHHGRFAPDDRRLLDAAVEAAFGRGSVARGLVLVATQTVEQSLDIDADVLVTDICPMDVLLQRLGRLHRHAREDRPASCAAPQAFVLVPAGGLLNCIRRPAHGIGPGRAYEDVRVVEGTLRQIAAHGSFVIPDMNRSLVETCVHREALEMMDAEDDRWATHGNEIHGRIIADVATANGVLLDIDVNFGGRPEAIIEDRKFSTRLGENDPSALFSPAPAGPFGSPVPMLRIPSWMLRGASPDKDERPMNVCKLLNGFSFSYGGQAFQYDATGLRRLD